MMKKRIALLGLLGCMALCSERVQAVTVLFDGQIYELSEGENLRYGSLSRIKAGETQADVDARLKVFFNQLDHKIVTPPVAPTSPVASKTIMVPPVPTQAQLDAAAMSATPVDATAASAAVAQPDEHEALSAGEKRALGLVGYGEAQVKGLDRTIRTQGRSAENVKEALCKADIAMRAAGNESSTRGLLDSKASPMRGPRGFSNADLDAMYARQLQEEEQQRVGVASTNPDEEADLNAAIMASMQSKSPTLSTGSVTPPAVAEENVRPYDLQYRQVMVAPGELGSQLTPAEIVDRNQELIRAELELANADAIAATERMLAREAAKEKAERLQAVIAAYETYRTLKAELGEEAVLNMLEGQFAQAEVEALTAALMSNLEQVAAAELITELLK